MAEPRMYRILQRIQSKLQEIVGTGGNPYHYTPEKVHVVRTWNDPRLFDDSVGASPTEGVIYAIRRVDRNHQYDTTGDGVQGCNLQASVDVVVLVSKKFNPSSPDDAPDGALVVERMLHDVARKLFFEDPGMGDEADTLAAAGAGADDSVIDDAPAGWAAAQIAFRVDYTYPAVEP